MVVQAAQTQLVPLREMTPAAVAYIRNSVISQVVKLASDELSIPESGLIVRDIEPYTDLKWKYCAADTTANTAENWDQDIETTTVGYITATGDQNMADQRFVAIFGIRDNRYGHGATGGATDQSGYAKRMKLVTLVKLTVGGAVKAIWDTSCLEAYHDEQAAFTPAAIVLPQNVAFNIYIYTRNINTKGTSVVGDSFLQLVGVVVEPRGKVVTP